VFDTECGSRVLTVLNSWDSGSNAITQDVTLDAGQYRLLIDMRYECPNATSSDGTTITTAGGNVCTSLTGVKRGSTTDYRYPSQASTWQQLCYDFELTEQQSVTLSLGFRTSASQGAANNTLLYIDHIRLLKATTSTDGILQQPRTTHTAMPVYDLQGRPVVPSVTRKGIYVQGGKKLIR
jgi:hypothetical protein